MVDNVSTVVIPKKNAIVNWGLTLQFHGKFSDFSYVNEPSGYIIIMQKIIVFLANYAYQF